MGFIFFDLHVSNNKPSSGDINLSNLPCSSLIMVHIASCLQELLPFVHKNSLLFMVSSLNNSSNFDPNCMKLVYNF